MKFVAAFLPLLVAFGAAAQDIEIRKPSLAGRWCTGEIPCPDGSLPQYDAASRCWVCAGGGGGAAVWSECMDGSAAYPDNAIVGACPDPLPACVSGDDLYLVTGAIFFGVDSFVSPCTVDGSDTLSASVLGGGTGGVERGGLLTVSGNERVGHEGDIDLWSGNAAGAAVDIRCNDSGDINTLSVDATGVHLDVGAGDALVLENFTGEFIAENATLDYRSDDLDGSDSAQWRFTPAGGFSHLRGSYFVMNGNEHAGGGDYTMVGGNSAGSTVLVWGANPADGSVTLRQSDGAGVDNNLVLDTSGFSFSADAGDDITINDGPNVRFGGSPFEILADPPVIGTEDRGIRIGGGGTASVDDGAYLELWGVDEPVFGGYAIFHGGKGLNANVDVLATGTGTTKVNVEANAGDAGDACALEVTDDGTATGFRLISAAGRDVAVGAGIMLDFASNGFTTEFGPNPALPGNTTFRLPPTNGTAGQVLTTDGTGVTAWSDIDEGNSVVILTETHPMSCVERSGILPSEDDNTLAMMFADDGVTEIDSSAICYYQFPADLDTGVPPTIRLVSWAEDDTCGAAQTVAFLVADSSIGSGEAVTTALSADNTQSYSIACSGGNTSNEDSLRYLTYSVQSAVAASDTLRVRITRDVDTLDTHDANAWLGFAPSITFGVSK
jgi:hypothetical protein